MNVYDLICVTILIFFVLSGSVRGLMRSVLSVASTVVSIYLTHKFYPIAVRLMRMSGVYTAIKQSLDQTINLQGTVNDSVRQFQTELIESLPQSPFILRHLHVNNNAEAYALLDVSTLSDYISAFFANMIINLIAGIILFIIIRLLLSVVLNSFSILTALPVIRQLNMLGGAIFGFAQGLFFIWIALCVLTFFFLDAKYADMFSKLESGVLTSFLYNNNPIMTILVKLVT